MTTKHDHTLMSKYRFVYTALSAFVIASLLVVSIYFATSLLKEVLTESEVFRGTHYDFLAFYGGAFLALHGHIAQIFNSEALTSFQRNIISHPVGATGYMPFLNPPFTAVLLAPLALLSIAKARLVWLALNTALMLWLVSWFTRSLTKRWRLVASALLLGTFPVYQALIEGQPSIILLYGCVLAYIYAQRQRYVLCGICLSVLWIKPQFAVFAIIGLIITRQWQVITSMLSTAVVLVLALLPITGLKLYFTYVNFMLQVISGHFNGGGQVVPTVWHGALNLSAGLNGFYTALIGQTHVYLINLFTALSVIALVVLFILAVKKTKPTLSSKHGKLMLAAAIAAALLIDPHLYAQDLVLVYLLLPLLAGFGHYLRTIVLVVLASDIVRIDQTLRIHVFTLLLMGFAVVVFVKTANQNPHIVKQAANT